MHVVWIAYGGSWLHRDASKESAAFPCVINRLAGQDVQREDDARNLMSLSQDSQDVSATTAYIGLAC